jgi:CheY-like chemotaxis protein
MTELTTAASNAARPILLVEDNPMDVDLTLQGFAEQGVKNPVVVCRDGEEALRFVEAHPGPDDGQLPALVLLDLRLPRVDGLEVLRQVRGRPAWADVAVVVLTTSRESSDLTAARELGATDYMVKPVDSEAFSETIRRIKLQWIVAGAGPSLASRQGPP